MMKKIKVRLGFLFGIMAFFTFQASATDAVIDGIVTAGDPVLSQWYGYSDDSTGMTNCFVNSTNLAATCNVPLLVVYGVTGCTYCNAFIGQLNLPETKLWVAQTKMMFVYMKSTTLSDANFDCLAAQEWIRPVPPGSYTPVYRFYWKKADGTVVTEAGSFKDFTSATFITKMQTLLSGYDNLGALISSVGGQFECGNIPTARLESEPTTETVEVPFVRTKGFSMPGTNHLVVTFPDSTVTTNTIVWIPGDTKKTTVVTGLDTHYVLDEKVELLLLDHALNPVETNAITYVAAVPNGALNPFFDEIPEVGEWTMDLEKATNATAQASGAAYTVVMFSGGFWCPWCIGMEDTIFATPEFKSFTQTNNIRLVMIDNPRRDATPPTLLRHAVDSARTKFSGSAYLSRNSITVEDAEERLIANSNQQYNAGWKFPGTTRIGYPTVLLLRKDGTIACRIGLKENGTTVTNEVTGVRSYPYDLAPALLRLNEALTLDADVNEEKNGHRTWTTETLSKDGTDTAQLSASDKNDVYLLTNVGSGMRQMIQITGPQAAMVTLSIQNAAGTTLVGPITNNLQTGFTLTNATPVAGSYLVVAATGNEFLGTNLVSTIRDYTITSTYVLTPSEAEASQLVTSATLLQMEIQSNTVYRFSGTYTVNPADFVDLGNNLWSALRTGITTVTFTGLVGEAPFTWRIWNPGVVGFVYTTTNVTETVGTCTVIVERKDGTAGAVDALVSLGGGTTAEPYRHAFPTNGITLHWADGQVGTTSVTFTVINDNVFDNNQVIQLLVAVTNAAPAAGIVVGKDVMSITVLENDQPVVGQLQFVPAPGQYFANTMTIVAEEGSVLPLAIERINGASSPVSATLTTTAGTLDETTLNWVNKDLVATKLVNLTVPLMAVAKIVTVTFTPTGITAVSGKSKLTILVVAARPAFALSTKALTLTTYVAVSEAIGVETQGAGRITLSRLSGSLPSGILVVYDVANQELVVKGTPTRVGQYSAVYQLSEVVGYTTVKGGTIRLDFNVRSLGTLNPSAVAKSYSFVNYAVVDPVTNRVTGLLNLTIGTTGRLTAKYLHAGGTISFSAPSWSEIEDDGTLFAEMQSAGYVLTVEMNVAGDVSALLTQTATNKDFLVDFTPATWSTLTPATDYQGYYTVALSANTVDDGAEAFGNLDLMPLGHSYMTLSMSASSARRGLMTYAGKLANGIAYSGSAVLLPYSGTQPAAIDYEYTKLGFFKKTGREILSGELAIQANADLTYQDYPRVVYGGNKADVADVWWLHTELVGDLSFAWKYGVYGGYYSSMDDLTAFYAEYGTTYGDAPMVLDFGGFLLSASPQYGVVTRYPGFYPLSITPTTIRLTTPVADGTATTFAFTKATGIFTGSFKMDFATKTGVSVKYQGVVLPAWTDCGCAWEAIKEMPFGLGTSTFTDKAVLGGSTRSLIRGCAIEINPRNL